MDRLILQNIIDVFQIEGRGTVVGGKVGPDWELAEIGSGIELLTPDGRRIRTAIKDKEIPKKGKLEPEPIPTGLVLLAEPVASEQLPRGTKILMISDGI